MMPKSTATRLPCAIDEQIALVHVGVEEAVADGMAQEALDHLVAERRQIEALAPCSAAMSAIGVPSIHSVVSTWRAVRCQSIFGTRKPRIVLGVLRHLGDGRGLHAQIEFELHRLLEHGDRRHGPQPAAFGADALDQAARRR